MAAELGKDPAWVSRSVREIQADFATVFSSPEESRLVSENLARFESLYAVALNTAFASTGYARTGALRLAAEVLRQKTAYELSLGYVKARQGRELGVPACPRCATLDDILAGFEPGALEAIAGEVGLPVPGAA